MKRIWFWGAAAVNFVAMLALWPHQYILAVITLVCGFALLTATRTSPVQYFATAVAAFLFEALSVKLGVWQHPVFTIWGVPFWIALAWANLFVITRNFDRIR